VNLQDIIVAPATPPGEGGVAIIRLSGLGCCALALKHFRASSSFDSPVSHFLYHGHFLNIDAVSIDEVMFVYMAAPRSFTAEDVVEIHCHGGQQIVSLILRTLIQAGARMAQPGEFSYRAFVNGRLDLSQAEAVADLIHARSEKSQSLALAQLDGQLSQTLHANKQLIRDALALIEAWIDFPEEELPDEDISVIRQNVSESAGLLSRMVGSYNTGRLYSEGVSLLLLGKPNVGKSSLMNALLGENRAIVTDIEGTTRDLLEEGLVVNGLPVRLVDTAGIRESSDPIEKEGVVRARNRVQSSDLVLLLVDGSRPVDDEDFSAHAVCSSAKYVTVVTKSDLASPRELPAEFSQNLVHVSSRTGEGLDRLRQKIYDSLVSDQSLGGNSVLLTSQRHHVAAMTAIDCLARFLDALEQSLSLEFLATDLRDALTALGDITGETTTDDVLDDIFSRFCIGK
jgi:tRNA modification GTPase